MHHAGIQYGQQASAMSSNHLQQQQQQQHYGGGGQAFNVAPGGSASGGSAPAISNNASNMPNVSVHNLSHSAISSISIPHSEIATTQGSTATLRQWRKKDDKLQTDSSSGATSSGEVQGPIARVAPHAHYPRTNDAYRYQNYSDYHPGIQPYKELSPVKFSEIVEPAQQPNHLTPVIQKGHKEKDYMEMYSVVQQQQVSGQSQMKPPYTPNPMVQYMNKECSVYPPQKESHHPYHHHALHKDYAYPTQNIKFSQYPRPTQLGPSASSVGMVNQYPNDFLGYVPAPHTNENLQQLYPYPNRAYMHQHRGYRNFPHGTLPTPAPTGNIQQFNFPRNPYASKYEHKLAAPHQFDARNISPRRIYDYPPRVSPNYAANHCSSGQMLEYSQHYQQNRRDFIMPQLGHQELPISKVPNYAQQMPDVVPDVQVMNSLQHQQLGAETHGDSGKSSLKQYFENWNDELMEEKREGGQNAPVENLYILESAEIPSENVGEFIHLQVDKLPENIKGILNAPSVITSPLNLTQDSVIREPGISVISETKKFSEENKTSSPGECETSVAPGVGSNSNSSVIVFGEHNKPELDENRNTVVTQTLDSSVIKTASAQQQNINVDVANSSSTGASPNLVENTGQQEEYQSPRTPGSTLEEIPKPLNAIEQLLDDTVNGDDINASILSTSDEKCHNDSLDVTKPVKQSGNSESTLDDSIEESEVTQGDDSSMRRKRTKNAAASKETRAVADCDVTTNNLELRSRKKAAEKENVSNCGGDNLNAAKSNENDAIRVEGDSVTLQIQGETLRIQISKDEITRRHLVTIANITDCDLKIPTKEVPTTSCETQTDPHLAQSVEDPKVTNPRSDAVPSTTQNVVKEVSDVGTMTCDLEAMEAPVEVGGMPTLDAEAPSSNESMLSSNEERSNDGMQMPHLNAELLSSNEIDAILFNENCNEVIIENESDIGSLPATPSPMTAAEIVPMDQVVGEFNEISQDMNVIEPFSEEATYIEEENDKETVPNDEVQENEEITNAETLEKESLNNNETNEEDASNNEIVKEKEESIIDEITEENLSSNIEVTEEKDASNKEITSVPNNQLIGDNKLPINEVTEKKDAEADNIEATNVKEISTTEITAEKVICDEDESMDETDNLDVSKMKKVVVKLKQSDRDQVNQHLKMKHLKEKEIETKTPKKARKRLQSFTEHMRSKFLKNQKAKSEEKAIQENDCKEKQRRKSSHEISEELKPRSKKHLLFEVREKILNRKRENSESSHSSELNKVKDIHFQEKDKESKRKRGNSESSNSEPEKKKDTEVKSKEKESKYKRENSENYHSEGEKKVIEGRGDKEKESKYKRTNSEHSHSEIDKKKDMIIKDNKDKQSKYKRENSESSHLESDKRNEVEIKDKEKEVKLKRVNSNSSHTEIEKKKDSDIKEKESKHKRENSTSSHSEVEKKKDLEVKEKEKESKRKRENSQSSSHTEVTKKKVKLDGSKSENKPRSKSVDEREKRHSSKSHDERSSSKKHERPRSTDPITSDKKEKKHHHSSSHDKKPHGEHKEGKSESKKPAFTSTKHNFSILSKDEKTKTKIKTPTRNKKLESLIESSIAHQKDKCISSGTQTTPTLHAPIKFTSVTMQTSNSEETKPITQDSSFAGAEGIQKIAIPVKTKAQLKETPIHIHSNIQISSEVQGIADPTVEVAQAEKVDVQPKEAAPPQLDPTTEEEKMEVTEEANLSTVDLTNEIEIETSPSEIPNDKPDDSVQADVITSSTDTTDSTNLETTTQSDASANKSTDSGEKNNNLTDSNRKRLSLAEYKKMRCDKLPSLEEERKKQEEQQKQPPAKDEDFDTLLERALDAPILSKFNIPPIIETISLKVIQRDEEAMSLATQLTNKPIVIELESDKTVRPTDPRIQKYGLQGQQPSTPSDTKSERSDDCEIIAVYPKPCPELLKRFNFDVPPSSTAPRNNTSNSKRPSTSLRKSAVQSRSLKSSNSNTKGASSKPRVETNAEPGQRSVSSSNRIKLNPRQRKYSRSSSSSSSSASSSESGSSSETESSSESSESDNSSPRQSEENVRLDLNKEIDDIFTLTKKKFEIRPRRTCETSDSDQQQHAPTQSAQRFLINLDEISTNLSFGVPLSTKAHVAKKKRLLIDPDEFNLDEEYYKTTSSSESDREREKPKKDSKSKNIIDLNELLPKSNTSNANKQPMNSDSEDSFYVSEAKRKESERSNSCERNIDEFMNKEPPSSNQDAEIPTSMKSAASYKNEEMLANEKPPRSNKINEEVLIVKVSNVQEDVIIIKDSPSSQKEGGEENEVKPDITMLNETNVPPLVEKVSEKMDVDDEPTEEQQVAVIKSEPASLYEPNESENITRKTSPWCDIKAAGAEDRDVTAGETHIEGRQTSSHEEVQHDEVDLEEEVPQALPEESQTAPDHGAAAADRSLGALQEEARAAQEEAEVEQEGTATPGEDATAEAHAINQHVDETSALAEAVYTQEDVILEPTESQSQIMVEVDEDNTYKMDVDSKNNDNNTKFSVIDEKSTLLKENLVDAENVEAVDEIDPGKDGDKDEENGKDIDVNPNIKTSTFPENLNSQILCEDTTFSEKTEDNNIQSSNLFAEVPSTSTPESATEKSPSFSDKSPKEEVSLPETFSEPEILGKESPNINTLDSATLVTKDASPDSKIPALIATNENKTVDEETEEVEEREEILHKYDESATVIDDKSFNESIIDNKTNIDEENQKQDEIIEEKCENPAEELQDFDSPINLSRNSNVKPLQSKLSYEFTDLHDDLNISDDDDELPNNKESAINQNFTDKSNNASENPLDARPTKLQTHCDVITDNCAATNQKLDVIQSCNIPNNSDRSRLNCGEASQKLVDYSAFDAPKDDENVPKMTREHFVADGREPKEIASVDNKNSTNLNCVPVVQSLHRIHTPLSTADTGDVDDVASQSESELPDDDNNEDISCTIEETKVIIRNLRRRELTKGTKPKDIDKPPTQTVQQGKEYHQSEQSKQSNPPQQHPKQMNDYDASTPSLSRKSSSEDIAQCYLNMSSQFGALPNLNLASSLYTSSFPNLPIPPLNLSAGGASANLYDYSQQYYQQLAYQQLLFYQQQYFQQLHSHSAQQKDKLEDSRPANDKQYASVLSNEDLKMKLQLIPSQADLQLGEMCQTSEEDKRRRRRRRLKPSTSSASVEDDDYLVYESTQNVEKKRNGGIPKLIIKRSISSNPEVETRVELNPPTPEAELLAARKKRKP